jgi:hypothetical protein
VSGVPAAKPTLANMQAHLSGELLSCFSGKASVDEMRLCDRAARLAMDLTALWTQMGSSSLPPKGCNDDQLATFGRLAGSFLKQSADLVTTLHKLSNGSTLLDATHTFKLAGIHASRADNVMLLNHLGERDDQRVRT